MTVLQALCIERKLKAIERLQSRISVLSELAVELNGDEWVLIHRILKREKTELARLTETKGEE